MSKNCPSCGAQVSDTAKFCRECGSKIEIEKIIYCEECGAKCKSTDKFCEECGDVRFNVSYDDWGSVGSVSNDGWGSVGSVSNDDWGSFGATSNDGWGSVGSKSDVSWEDCESLLNAAVAALGDDGDSRNIMSKNCPSCGAQVSDTAKFCRECGSKIEIEKIIYCEECGAKCKSTDKFCEECGFNLSGDTASANNTVSDISYDELLALLDFDGDISDLLDDIVAAPGDDGDSATLDNDWLGN